MNRLPFLLIALFFTGIACVIIFTAFSVNTAPAFEQDKAAAQGWAVLSIATLVSFFLGLIIWLWALMHMLTNKDLQGTDKIVWVLVIIFLNVLGAILYFILRPRLHRASETLPIQGN